MSEYIRYIKIAINRPAYDAVVAICAEEFAKVRPDNVLSINENDAGSLAVIKVVSDNLDYIDTLPLAPQQVFEEPPIELVKAVNWHTPRTLP